MPSSCEVTICSYEEQDSPGFDATLRLGLSTKQEVLLWLQEFEAVSKTTLRKCKTFPHVGGKLLFKVSQATIALSRVLRSWR